jgi:hypothetical protein
MTADIAGSSRSANHMPVASNPAAASATSLAISSPSTVLSGHSTCGSELNTSTPGSIVPNEDRIFFPQAEAWRHWQVRGGGRGMFDEREFDHSVTDTAAKIGRFPGDSLRRCCSHRGRLEALPY